MAAIAPVSLSARTAACGTRVTSAAKKAAVARNTVVRAERSASDNAKVAAAAVTLAAAPAAQASELGEDLFSVIEVIDKAADKVETAFGVVSGAAGKVVSVFETVAPIVSPIAERAVKAAAPVGKAVGDLVGRTVSPVVSIAQKTVVDSASSAVSAAGAALKEQGVDVTPAVTVAQKASGIVVDTVSTVAPTVTGAIDAVTSATPTDFVEYGIAAGVLSLAVPALSGAIGSAVRGYAGEVRPVEAYDQILKGGNIVIVDVRRDNEVDRAGEIEFPRRAAGRVKAVPREKLQGSFKAIGEVEANLTAIKIASLNGIKKGTTVLMLDSNGGDAGKVAAALSGQGFSKVFVVEGGFNGWVKAGLATKATNIVTGQLFLPGSDN